MGNVERDAPRIIAEARETLETARMGYEDFVGSNPVRRLPGLRNAVVFGRAVTNVIEGLRSRVSDFDQWYKPRSQQLREDPGFRRLYQLRSEVLKQGATGASVSMIFQNLTSDVMASLMSDPPPRARSFFIGDVTGGSGWEVEAASGKLEKYYVSLPDVSGISISHTIEVNGVAVDASELIRAYLDAMQSIVDDAAREFV